MKGHITHKKTSGGRWEQNLIVANMSKWTTEFGCPTTRFVIDGPHLQGQAQVFHTWISNKFRGTFFKKEASRILTDESPKWPGETHLLDLG